MKEYLDQMYEISRHFYDNEEKEYALLINLYRKLWPIEDYSDKKLLIFAMQDAIKLLYIQEALEELGNL